MPDRGTNGRSKGELEAAIRTAIIKFEQEFLGRGPDDVRASLVKDLVVIRLKGVLTPAERQLAKTPEGVDMVSSCGRTSSPRGGIGSVSRWPS